MTKLWLIEQFKNRGYDTYDSAIVAAEDSFEASLTPPMEGYVYDWENRSWKFENSGGFTSFDCWADPEDVKVTYLGDTTREISGVVLASFNAG
jgi:hypothetical protein